MDKDQVLTLMKSSKTSDEWNANCGKVKAACGGYPEYWFQEVVMTRLADKVLGQGAGDITITRS